MNDRDPVSTETMHKLLTMGIDIVDELTRRRDARTVIEVLPGVKLEGGSIHIDEVVAIVRKGFGAPLVRKREDLIGELIARVLNDHGFTTCAVWAIAHNLEHILYEDLDYFDN